MVPSTSNHWPYTDLLVFCLKFRLSPVCECLICYYKTSNDYWTIPEKIQTRWVWRNFQVCHFKLWKFWTKQSFILANSIKLCYTPWKFQGQKWRLMEIQHDFFLIDPENPTSFSVNYWNFDIYIYIYKFRYINWSKILLKLHFKLELNP